MHHIICLFSSGNYINKEIVKMNGILKEISNCLIELDSKIKHSKKKEHFKDLLKSDIVDKTTRIKELADLLEKQYSSIDNGKLDTVEDTNFDASKYNGLIDKVKEKYFSNTTNKKALIENLCLLFNIQIEYVRCQVENPIKKTKDGYTILIKSNNSIYTENFYIFNCILAIILFNEAAVCLSENCKRLICIAIRRIFFPDDLYIEKAIEFNYDCDKLSHFFEFSPSLMYINSVVIKRNSKIPDDVDFIYTSKHYNYD